MIEDRDGFLRLRDDWLIRRTLWAPTRSEIDDEGSARAQSLETNFAAETILANQLIHLPYHLSSHRPILGPWIVGGKRLVLAALRPLVRLALWRQYLINHSLSLLITDWLEDRRRLRDLEQKVEDLLKKSGSSR